MLRTRLIKMLSLMFCTLIHAQRLVIAEEPIVHHLAAIENGKASDSLKNTPEKWKLIYLATYPRSGNHWMRFLIEETTGVATSSVYRDPDPQHDLNPYPWGGYSIDGGYIKTARLPTEDDLIIIKTHYPALHLTVRDQRKCIKTIRVIRHPIDSLYSHYSYKFGAAEIIPVKWLEQYISVWAKFQEYWNEQPDVVSIRYEDLMDKPFENLSRILKTIGLNVTDNDIHYALTMHPPIGKPLKHIIRYDTHELEMIEKKLHDLMEKFGYTISGVDYNWSPELIGQ